MNKPRLPSTGLAVYWHAPSVKLMNKPDFDNRRFAAYRDGNIMMTMTFHQNHDSKDWIVTFSPMSLESNQSFYVKSAAVRHMNQIIKKDVEQSYALETAGMKDVHGNDVYRADIDLFDDIKLEPTDNSELMIYVTYDKESNVKTVSFKIVKVLGL